MLDLKDRKLLLHLDKNARQSLSAIARKIGVSQEVAFRRVKKLEQQGIIKRYQAVINNIGYFSAKLYLRLQDMTAEKEKELHHYLLNNPDIFWFGICQGRWDLNIAYWARDVEHFGQQVDDLLNKFSANIQEREATISRKSTQYNRRWLIENKELPVETVMGVIDNQQRLNEIDTLLLRWLANNARMTSVELGKRCGLSAPAVVYRIKQLEKRGILSGYKIALDPHKLEYETCKCFIYLKNITSKRKKQLIEYCKLLPQLINTVQCVGPWDIEFEFEVKNFDQYYTLMHHIQNKFQDIIKNYESVLFKEEPKQSFMPRSYPQLA
jgi:Lrp/AsnC family leucine-responsive transcriptional regulator